MKHEPMGNLIGPLAARIDRTVEVQDTTTRIRDLRIERANVCAYLGSISPDKQEIALVHALEVGITEILARRGNRRQPS